MEEKQSVEILEPPKKKFGGAQPGAGRKPGTTNKLSAAALLEALDDALGIPYEKQLANNYLNALHEDRALVQKYDQLFLSKVIADKIDITSNGVSIAPQLNFNTKEIDDYIDV
jgi:hypothetical protein